MSEILLEICVVGSWSRCDPVPPVILPRVLHRHWDWTSRGGSLLHSAADWQQRVEMVSTDGFTSVAPTVPHNLINLINEKRLLGSTVSTVCYEPVIEPR